MFYSCQFSFCTHSSIHETMKWIDFSCFRSLSVHCLANRNKIDSFWLFYQTIFITQSVNCSSSISSHCIYGWWIFFLSKLYIENVIWFRFVCTFVPLFGTCIHFIWFLLPNDQYLNSRECSKRKQPRFANKRASEIRNWNRHESNRKKNEFGWTVRKGRTQNATRQRERIRRMCSWIW